MNIAGINYQPFVFGHAPLCKRLVENCPLPDVHFIDVLAPESLPFFHLLNAGNALAFGTLGMPAWVQLDCATLPSAMVGFALTREQLEPSLWSSLVSRIRQNFGEAAAAAIATYRGLVPVSEYCALPTFESGTVVGFSLFSIARGAKLGVRSKALALRCYGARRQVGVTQYDNSAARTHCAFGPLEILSTRAAPHSRPDDSFVYSVDVPSETRLDALIASGLPDGTSVSPDLLVPLEAHGMGSKLSELQAKYQRLAVVWPGIIDRPEGQALAMKVLNAK